MGLPTYGAMKLSTLAPISRMLMEVALPDEKNDFAACLSMYLSLRAAAAAAAAFAADGRPRLHSDEVEFCPGSAQFTRAMVAINYMGKRLDATCQLVIALVLCACCLFPHTLLTLGEIL